MTPDEFDLYMKNHLPDFEIATEKGQRIFRSKIPYDNHPEYEKMKKYEVFVSNLPNDLFENELLPFLCRVGSILQTRIIMNFSGTSKGMAYVVFNQVDAAFRAVEELNNEYIRASGKDCDRQVHVAFSVNNNRLVFYNIPPDKTVEEVKIELDKKMENVTAVKLFSDHQGVNATVTFTSHKWAHPNCLLLSSVTLFSIELHLKPGEF